MASKKIKIIVSIVGVAIISILLWFGFDCSSKMDVLKNPEKYSFRMNFASFILQNDYYLYAKYPNSTDTFFKESISLIT